MHLDPPWLRKILKFTILKKPKTRLNVPPWVEKILKITMLKNPKIRLNKPPRLEKILKFTIFERLEVAIKITMVLESHYVEQKAHLSCKIVDGQYLPQGAGGMAPCSPLLGRHWLCCLLNIQVVLVRSRHYLILF